MGGAWSLRRRQMRFTVFALDYDGTVAHGGVLDPEVRRAIADARERGIIVAIVTGRILNDLRRVAGDLRFVDAVVAENGAVGSLGNIATAAPSR